MGAGLLGLPAAASAANLSCSAAAADHCYSVIQGTGTTFYGAYGTWNRAGMDASNDSTHQRLMTSELWAEHDTSNWVEAGDTVGYFHDFDTGDVFRNGYRAFWAAGFHDLATYREHSITNLAFDVDVTDEWQVSRSTTTNKWRIYFDGNVSTTADLGFWSTPILSAGGEVGTPVGSSGLFTMNLRGITAAGSRVGWGTETTHVDSGLYGNRPADSTWKWRIPS